MECKLGLNVIEDALSVIELIETLWNVNEEEQKPKKKSFFELIETLWNVNRL